MAITLAEIIEKAKERSAKLIREMPDERAKQYFMVFPEWEQGKEYTEGQRIRVGEKLYRVLKDHTAEAKPGEDAAVYLAIE